MLGVDGYIWTSSNTYVATVEEQDYSGFARGWHAGSTTISVRAYVGDCLGAIASRTLVVNNCGWKPGAGNSDFTVAPVSVDPNPAGEQAWLRLDLAMSAEVDFTIQDLNGRIVYRENPGRMDSGLHRLALNTAGWANGVYVVKARIGNEPWMYRFVVQR